MLVHQDDQQYKKYNPINVSKYFKDIGEDYNAVLDIKKNIGGVNADGVTIKGDYLRFFLLQKEVDILQNMRDILEQEANDL